jgi:acetyl-CoA carboxylase biotin carboxylase subunit
LEQYVEFGRHIEFQFLADSFGNAVHLGERECSVQRSHQKLVEESPSPIVDPHLREEMGERVRHAVAAIGYVGAGTMEFLRAPNGDLYFMEVNTRLQVEHPVTEMVTGFDLVEEQIRVAANHELSMRQADVHIKGHAIECRVNAEDPLDGFKPCPGLVERFEPPEEATGVRVRVDTYVSSGTRIPVFYDSLVCKLIVAGEDRDTTRRGMIEALKRFRVEGIKTTIPLHIKIMENAVFASGNYNTSLLSQILD